MDLFFQFLVVAHDLCFFFSKFGELVLLAGSFAFELKQFVVELVGGFEAVGVGFGGGERGGLLYLFFQFFVFLGYFGKFQFVGVFDDSDFFVESF